MAAAFDGRSRYFAVGSKHGNACGAAAAPTKAEAIQRMLEGDLRAIFGGCVMLGFDVGAEEAELLLNHESPTRRLPGPCLRRARRGRH